MWHTLLIVSTVSSTPDEELTLAWGRRCLGGKPELGTLPGSYLTSHRVREAVCNINCLALNTYVLAFRLTGTLSWQRGAVLVWPWRLRVQEMKYKPGSSSLMVWFTHETVNGAWFLQLWEVHYSCSKWCAPTWMWLASGVAFAQVSARVILVATHQYNPISLDFFKNSRKPFHELIKYPMRNVGRQAFRLSDSV